MQKHEKQQTREKHHKKEIDLAYEFFLQCEEQGRIVCLEDIVEATTYSYSTAKIYVSKKWWWFLIETLEGTHIVRGLKGYTLEEFRDVHRQKRGPLSKGLSSQFSISLSTPLLTWLTEKARLQECPPHVLMAMIIQYYCEANGFSDASRLPLHIQVQTAKRGNKKRNSQYSTIMQLSLLSESETVTHK